MAVTPTTWNPSDKGANVVLSNGNLTAVVDGNDAVRAVAGVSTGKWYWEITGNNVQPIVGLGRSTALLTNYPGQNANSWAVYYFDGTKYHNNVGTAYNGVAVGVASVIGVLLDMDAGTVSFIIGGVNKGVAFSGLTGTVYPMAASGSNSIPATVTANFGATAFAYPVPAGYRAGIGAYVGYTLSGNVKDETEANVARTVRAYLRSSGVLAGSTVSDGSTGNWSMTVDNAGEHDIVILDDASSDPLFNDLIVRTVAA